MLFSTTVYASGTIDLSYQKNIQFGYAVKDNIYQFQASWEIQIVGSESKLGNANFLKIYKETENGLLPIDIKITKVGEVPIVGDIIDWWNYGSNITKFSITPLDPSEITDGFYYYYFQTDVATVSFVYNSNHGPMFVINENSVISDFYITDVDTKVIIKNQTDKILDEVLGNGMYLETIQKDLKSTLQMSTNIDSKLYQVQTSTDNIESDLTTLKNYTLDVYNQLKDLNYKFGFLLLSMAFTAFMFLTYKSFRLLVWDNFKYYMRGIF